MNTLEAPVFAPEDLVRRALGNTMLARKLLDLFLLDLPDRVAAIHAAAAEGNMSLLRQQAHALKGAALTVGAMRLAQRLEGLEAVCRTGIMAGGSGVLPAGDGLVMATREQMQQWLNDPGEGPRA